MESIAAWLAQQGYTLRSGGADGADQAFERGARRVPGPEPEILRVEDATREAMRMAADIHPNWRACNDYARMLHGRDCQQVLGRELDTPVQFVICWTRGGRAVGGTATAIVCAQRNRIPIFNLAVPADLNRIVAKLEKNHGSSLRT